MPLQRLALRVQLHSLAHVGQPFGVAPQQVQYPRVGVEAVGVVGLGLYGAAAHRQSLLQLYAAFREVVCVVVQRPPVVGVQLQAAVEAAPGALVVACAVRRFGHQAVGLRLEVSLREAPLLGLLQVLQGLGVALVLHVVQGLQVVRQRVHREQACRACRQRRHVGLAVRHFGEAYQQPLPHLVAARVALQAQLQPSGRLAVFALPHQHVAVEQRVGRCVVAMRHHRVQQPEGPCALRAVELLGRVERRQQLHLRAAVKLRVGEGQRQLLRSLRGLAHSLPVLGQLYVYVFVVGVGSQHAVVVLLRPRILLALHVGFGQHGLVALLLRHGLGQGLHLLLRLVGLAGGVPQALLLQRDGLRHTYLLLHAVQRPDGALDVARRDVGVAQLVVVFQLVGPQLHDALPRGHQPAPVALHRLHLGLLQQVPPVGVGQRHSASYAGPSAVRPAPLQQLAAHLVPCGTAARLLGGKRRIGLQGLVVVPAHLQRLGVDEGRVGAQSLLAHLAYRRAAVAAPGIAVDSRPLPAAARQHHAQRRVYYIFVLFLIHTLNNAASPRLLPRRPIK